MSHEIAKAADGRLSNQEQALRDLESHFPATAGAAFAAARAQTLASGQSVLQSEQGVIYEVFPDGSRRLVKQIEKPIQVKRGLKLILQ